MDQEGKVVHRLFGKWHEGLYCGVAPSAKCVWRPGETRRSVQPQEAPERSDRGRESPSFHGVHLMFSLIMRLKT